MQRGRFIPVLKFLKSALLTEKQQVRFINTKISTGVLLHGSGFRYFAVGGSFFYRYIIALG